MAMAAAEIEAGRALKIVLDELERADARDVIGAAVGDLVACGAWTLAGNVEGRHRANAAQPLLTPCNRRPPGYTPLAEIDELLRAAPKAKRAGISGRDPAQLADFVADRDGGARAVIDGMLDALVAAGVLARGEAYAIGAFRGVRHTRTEAGDALRRAALPEHPRLAVIARAIVEDEITRALARGSGGQRGTGPDSSGGSNTGAAIRYGGGV
jgi:hypothetical protein